jgi:hypothetical protein
LHVPEGDTTVSFVERERPTVGTELREGFERRGLQQREPFAGRDLEQRDLVALLAAEGLDGEQAAVGAAGDVADPALVDAGDTAAERGAVDLPDGDLGR